jgi:threonine dehydratase
MVDFAVTAQDVYAARRRIAPLIWPTPLVRSPALSAGGPGEVHLKLENQQRTGAFKIRGAANKLLALTPEERARGVITVSSGNHGRAVADVAGRLGVRAVVCVSELVPHNKVEAIRALGAEVVVHGRSYDEAEARSVDLACAERLTPISPFDDPHVIAGQGTIGLELLEALPRVDTVIVPLSGGGLIGGIGLALKAALPDVHLVGVSMARGPVMVRSLGAGRPVELVEEETLADALTGGIGLDNRHTFRLVRALVDETVLVSEEEIAAAMAFLLHTHHLVVEGGGAVGVAALRAGKVTGRGTRTAVVVSGGNVDVSRLLSIARAYPPSGVGTSREELVGPAGD